MKAYTVTETEFVSLPMWKAILKFSDHVAIASGSFASGLVLQAAFMESLPPVAKAVLAVGLVFAAFIGVAALCLRKQLSKCGRDIEAIIKTETMHDKDEP